MSFWPFPTNLLTEIRGGAASGPVVEGGVGDGRLSERLRECGVDVLGVDRDPFLRGVDVLADLRELPFRDGSVGAIVLGDVLRHLDRRDRGCVAEECVRVLDRGGRVIVLEDEADGRDAAERNYRDVLALLADLVPGRGPARRVEDLTRAWRSRMGPPIVSGGAENETPVDDPEAPLRWVRTHTACDRTCRERVDDLHRRIERDGMRYGRFAYEVYVREGNA